MLQCLHLRFYQGKRSKVKLLNLARTTQVDLLTPAHAALSTREDPTEWKGSRLRCHHLHRRGPQATLLRRKFSHLRRSGQGNEGPALCYFPGERGCILGCLER